MLKCISSDGSTYYPKTLIVNGEELDQFKCGENVVFDRLKTGFYLDFSKIDPYETVEGPNLAWNEQYYVCMACYINTKDYATGNTVIFVDYFTKLIAFGYTGNDFILKDRVLFTDNSTNLSTTTKKIVTYRLDMNFKNNNLLSGSKIINWKNKSSNDNVFMIRGAVMSKDNVAKIELKNTQLYNDVNVSYYVDANRTLLLPKNLFELDPGFTVFQKSVSDPIAYFDGYYDDEEFRVRHDSMVKFNENRSLYSRYYSSTGVVTRKKLLTTSKFIHSSIFINSGTRLDAFLVFFNPTESANIYKNKKVYLNFTNSNGVTATIANYQSVQIGDDINNYSWVCNTYDKGKGPTDSYYNGYLYLSTLNSTYENTDNIHMEIMLFDYYKR